jgi:hypothetical protein
MKNQKVASVKGKQKEEIPEISESSTRNRPFLDLQGVDIPHVKIAFIPSSAYGCEVVEVSPISF